MGCLGEESKIGGCIEGENKGGDRSGVRIWRGWERLFFGNFGNEYWDEELLG